MTDLTTFYQRMYQNLFILKQRQARYGGPENAPPELLGQIENYERAIFLTRQRLDSLISQNDWQTALKSLQLTDVPAEPVTAAGTPSTTPLIGDASSPPTTDYHRANIRQLLTKGFSDTELRNFCFDQAEFQEVYDQLAQDTGKEQIVSLIIEHADQNLLFDQLLAWAKKSNPTRYKRHQPYVIR